MEIKHFYHKKYMSHNDIANLNTLIEDCNFISEKNIQSIVDPDNLKSVICCYNKYGDICGFATVIEEEDYLYLSELFVSFYERGKGFGGALLEQVRKYARAKKYDEVCLLVKLENKSAIKIYKHKRFLYEKLDKQYSSVLMKQYVSSGDYHRGAILFEIAKEFGLSNLKKGLSFFQKNENISCFYKYFRGESKDTLIRQHLDSATLNCCAKLAEKVCKCDDKKFVLRLSVGRPSELMTAQEKTNFSDILALKPEIYKKIGLGVKSLFDFQTNENIKLEIEDLKINEKEKRI